MANENPEPGGANDYEVFGSGTVPQTSTTRRMNWVKKLWTIQTNLGVAAKSHNNPTRADTVRLLILKCVRAVNGS